MENPEIIERVSQVIRESVASDAEYDRVADMVWLVMNRVVPDDLEKYQVLGVEKKAVAHGITGVADLILEDSQGRRIIVDWKTRVKGFSREWYERIPHSIQWQLYCYLFDADLFYYRAVSPTSFNQVKLEPPEGYQEKIQLLLRQTDAMMEALRSGKTPWPRRMPDACFNWGSRCPYWDQCTGNQEVSGYPHPELPYSYTSLSTFYLCPEKYRLTYLECQDPLELDVLEEESFYTRIGKAFHQAMALVYTEAEESK